MFSWIPNMRRIWDFDFRYKVVLSSFNSYKGISNMDIKWNWYENDDMFQEFRTLKMKGRFVKRNAVPFCIIPIFMEFHVKCVMNLYWAGLSVKYTFMCIDPDKTHIHYSFAVSLYIVFIVVINFVKYVAYEVVT